MISILNFQVSTDTFVHHGDWSLVAIALNANSIITKGETKARSCVTVSFNGLKCLPLLSDSLASDMPDKNQAIEMTIGRFRMDLTNAYNEASEVLEFGLFMQPAWSLGPFHLFDEFLSSDSIAMIFLRGPTYKGSSFQADSPLYDHLPSMGCDLLSRCHRCLPMSVSSVGEYIKELGLEGLESLVEPAVERNSSLIQVCLHMLQFK